jgi:hypothetical protein
MHLDHARIAEWREQSGQIRRRVDRLDGHIERCEHRGEIFRYPRGHACPLPDRGEHPAEQRDVDLAALGVCQVPQREARVGSLAQLHDQANLPRQYLRQPRAHGLAGQVG